MTKHPSEFQLRSQSWHAWTRSPCFQIAAKNADRDTSKYISTFNLHVQRLLKSHACCLRLHQTLTPCINDWLLMVLRGKADTQSMLEPECFANQQWICLLDGSLLYKAFLVGKDNGDRPCNSWLGASHTPKPRPLTFSHWDPPRTGVVGGLLSSASTQQRVCIYELEVS